MLAVYLDVIENSLIRKHDNQERGAEKKGLDFEMYHSKEATSRIRD